MGIGIGTLVAGLFGMNVSKRAQYSCAQDANGLELQLRSHLEDSEFAFFLMSLFSVVMAMIFSWGGLRTYVVLFLAWLWLLISNSCCPRY